MASSGLRDELACSICLSPYTDPVSLTCGHNFCRSCIVRALDAQEAAGAYSCPDCRAEYPQRPALEKNRKLRNIVQRFLSAQPEMEETTIFCTYCIKSPVAAVRSCLQCETSLCDDHLTAHNKTMDHILTEPTRSFGSKKCSTHKKVLEYYCPQDAACLCVSCWVVGKHEGHQVELLDDASEKKRRKLSKDLDELNPQKEELQRRVWNLHYYKQTIRKEASEKSKNISKLFMGTNKQLTAAEKKTVSEISRQENKIVSQVSHLINKLESKGHELSRKRRHVQEMCRITDPVRLLQESDITVSSDRDGGKISFECNLDENLISMSLYRSMRDIVTNVTSELGFQIPHIVLDVDTANRYVKISDDLRTATDTREEQDRTESPGEFLTYSQVLSRCGFSSGRHYWEVEWNQIGTFGIGMSYPSIEREGNRSGIGYNNKSWCLDICDRSCDAVHNFDGLTLNIMPTCPTFGVFLDYEAGRLSFYELCDPIRHLHTFTASFTEPLHVGFYVGDGASVTIIS